MKGLLVAVVLLAAAVGMSGCKITEEFTTTVLPGGDLDHTAVMVVDMRSPEATPNPTPEVKEEQSVVDGWEVLARSEGEELTTVRAHKVVRPGEILTPPSDDPNVKDGMGDISWDLQVEEQAGTRERRLTIKIPADPKAANEDPSGATEDPKKSPDDQQMEDGMTEMLESLIEITWTVNIPGEIVSTNAGERTETGVVWRLGMAQIHEGLDLTVVAREPMN